MHTISFARERWHYVGWLSLFLFCSVVSLLCATRPTVVILGTAFVWRSILALVDLFCRRLPRLGIEVVDRLHSWCDHEGYIEAAALRRMRLEGYLSGFHYSAFVACCREVRPLAQHSMFCCGFAGFVRKGLVSEEAMNDLLEHSTWPEAHFWFQGFLHDTLPTVGGADSPRA